MLHYILQTVAFQLFFLLIYEAFLKSETFFNWNRMYLLITAVASIVLPFIRLESIKTIVPENFVIRLPEVIIGNTELDQIPTAEISSDHLVTSSFIWSWDYLWYAGMVIATAILLYKLVKISLLIQNNQKCWNGNHLMVHLPKSNVAFSFFHYVFLGDDLNDEEKRVIIAHESIHASQKHTLDLLFFELLRIVFWFNPLVYSYQNRMCMLHEYIADAKAMKQSNKTQYYQNLLSQVFDTQQISFTNTFYQSSLIKKRIVMLSKSKSHKIHLLKYALLLPLVFGMLMYTSSYAQVNNTGKTSTNQELSFDELKEKYYKEIVELYAQNTDRSENRQKYDIRIIPVLKEKYMKSRDEVAKLYAYIKWSGEEYLAQRKAEGTYEEKDLEFVSKAKAAYKSYEAYRAFLKTDEAKLDWESDIKDGELRLVVVDVLNMTAEEKKKEEKKLALIVKDSFFHALIITDGKLTTKVDFENITKSNDINSIVYYDSEVPFSVIDEVPTFKACQSLATADEKRQCTSDMMAAFVNKNFNVKLVKELGLTGKQRISVMFKIDTNGDITEIKSRAPHPALEAEAVRVISELPQMTPGIHNGKAVVVPYSLPILFKVGE